MLIAASVATSASAKALAADGREPCSPSRCCCTVHPSVQSPAPTLALLAAHTPTGHALRLRRQPEIPRKRGQVRQRAQNILGSFRRGEGGLLRKELAQ